MRKILSISLIVSVIQLCLSSCSFKTEFEFLEETSKIVSVDVIEAICDNETSSYTQHHVLNITDVNTFLEKIGKLKHKSYTYTDVRSYAELLIGFKISYSNGDYEFFNDNQRVKYNADSGFENFGSGTYFKANEFYSLLFSYVSNVKNQKFNHIRERERIMSIDIVEKKYDESSKTVQETNLVTINNINNFLLELESIEYTYMNEKIKKSTYQEMRVGDNTTVIKISYQNGETEIFDHHTREVCMLYPSGAIGNKSVVYIGTFNQEQFNTLINKYIE